MSGLHATFDQVLWILNAYLLSFSVLLIVAGKLGDIAGPRNIFVAGPAICTATSAWCGLAPDGHQLIAARVLQGVGGSLLAPQALAFITRLFPEDRRGAAFGVWSAVGSLGTVVGPTLGGLVVTGIDWRWIFFINVPIGVATIAAAFAFVPDLRPGRSHRFDLVGVLLSTIGLFAITFGLIEGQRYDWGVVRAGVTIAEIVGGGLILFVLFIAWELAAARAACTAEPISGSQLLLDERRRHCALVRHAGRLPANHDLPPIGARSLGPGSRTCHRAADGGCDVHGAGVGPCVGPDRWEVPACRRPGRVRGRRCLARPDGWSFVHLAGSPRAVPPWRSGSGLVFAPLPTIALKRVVPAMAGSASGVLNTTRQLGFAMATGVIGAVLHSQLTAALHDRAMALSVALPPSSKQGFINSFSNAGKAGLALGRGQPGAAQLPAGLPPVLKAQLLSLAHAVFVNG